ncbi:MAG TPA: hypothetical protein VFZ19_07105 [Solirubrobacterales bacterium]
MKLPSHNTVIAYLALFVALGGTAYAATQLPKNSVGPKQLKANAVTTAKIKNGAVNGSKIGANAVTGANVDESTLGRVPSAASAEKATTADKATAADRATTAESATNAANANALGGVPGSDFLRTNAVQFHTGALNACFKQTLVEVPGWFQITTVGDCQPEFKFIVKNTSLETWEFIYEAGSTTLPSESSSTLNFAPANSIDLFAISTANPTRHALIDCAIQESSVPIQISCSTRVPPAV